MILSGPRHHAADPHGSALTQSFRQSLTSRSSLKCLTVDGAGVRTEECLDTPSQVLVDRYSDQSLATFNVGSMSGFCIVRTGTSAVSAGCNIADPNQRWSDAPFGLSSVSLCDAAGLLSYIPSSPTVGSQVVDVVQNGSKIRTTYRAVKAGGAVRIFSISGLAAVATFIDGACRGLFSSGDTIPTERFQDYKGRTRWLAHGYLIPGPQYPAGWYSAESPFLSACGVTTDPVSQLRYRYTCLGDPDRRVIFGPQ